MSLAIINETVQQAALAITAALELETEIVDNNLKIIGGTGRYYTKIGQFEEGGKLNTDLIYATCLRNGDEYINFNPGSDPRYKAKEGEMAEICCPIKLNTETIGLIGLIAFTDNQRKLLMNKITELTRFLRSMAVLISGKYEAELNNMQLKETVSSLLPSNEGTSFDNIIGESISMINVKRRALQISCSDSTVLITGESGTGKDLLSRAIHKESNRRDKPFVSINCAAIPEMLLESELFGYEKGSFTGASNSGKLGKFQLADGGTIFLDEIGDMPLHLQVKLLSVLQNHQIDPIGSSKPIDIDVRIIAATNKNLEEMIRQKQFREDLYFRLNVIPLSIPPVRQRKEDISLLLHNSLDKFSSKLEKPVHRIDAKALKALQNYSWPGNVREIENVIEYAVNMASDNTITIHDLPEKILPDRLCPESVASNINFTYMDSQDLTGTSLKSRLDAAKREIISASLDTYGWSLEGKRKAAESLNISESTLYRHLRTLKLL